ncbi:hypothetical protein [Streptomyces sp. G45]|uniref:hypothetical protein n=1 Tax=Streptomyces sp. G45 TaxID=3406627 RepID=UPI003C1B3E04
MRTREVVRVVGRRRALRLLVVGAVAAAVSACGGDGGDGGDGGTEGAARGVKARALGAFAVGDWACRTSEGREGVFTIGGDGTWSETVLGLSGRWTLDKKGLTVVTDGVDSEELVDKPYTFPRGTERGVGVTVTLTRVPS